MKTKILRNSVLRGFPPPSHRNRATLSRNRTQKTTSQVPARQRSIASPEPLPCPGPPSVHQILDTENPLPCPARPTRQSTSPLDDPDAVLWEPPPAPEPRGSLHRNRSERLAAGTNNRAELAVAVAAMKDAVQGSPLVVRTDSAYVVGAATTWGPEWEAHAWAPKPQARPGAAPNGDLVKALLDALREHGAARIEKAKAHDGVSTDGIENRG